MRLSRNLKIFLLGFGITHPLLAQSGGAGVRFYQTPINQTFLANDHADVLVVPTDSIVGNPAEREFGIVLN